MMESFGGQSSPRLTNVVINGDTALAGGGMYNYGDGYGITKPILINCILWNNHATFGNVFINFFDTSFVYHSIVQGSSNNINHISISDNFMTGFTFDGGNNKFQSDGIDPLFFDAPIAFAAPTSAGNFHVGPFSPAIDMGNDAANSELTDLDGLPRKSNTIDIGAYEFQQPDCNLFTTSILYVNAMATGANTGNSWINAFQSLQDALIIAKFCNNIDTIKVAQGTYYPSDSVVVFDGCGVPIDTLLPDRNIAFNIPDSVVLQGGYGHGADTLIRDWQCHKTILCGEIQQDGDSSNNSYNVVITKNVDSVTTVDGFCITEGNANGNSSLTNSGGGWHNDGSDVPNYASPTILNCIISGNSAIRGGGIYNGGIYYGQSSPILTNVVISGNDAVYGGGIFNDGFGGGGNSSPILTNVIISGNYASYQGGGMFNQGGGGNSSPILTNVVISGNYADNGGAMFNDGQVGQCSPVLINCILWNNQSNFGNVFNKFLGYQLCLLLYNSG
ncbi:MAG: hypothetical protein IPO25_07175 [Saprospiraceae bacterium]|nr:hypothetical protein [Saprospiraceae bacterium]